MRKFSERVSSDVFLAFTSILIACVIWLIAKGNDTGQETLRLVVNLQNKPDNVEAQIPREFTQIKATASFPKSLQAHILSSNFEVTIDWNNIDSQDWVGIKEHGRSPWIALESKGNIQPLASLSQDVRARIERQVQFLGLEPSRIYINAKHIVRPIRLAIPTTGTLPDGYYLAGPLTRPRGDTLLLTASKTRFFALNASAETTSVRVSTEPIDLTNRTATFTESTNLVLPQGTELLVKGDNRGRAEDQRRIEVRVPIAESFNTKTFDGVPIEIRVANPNMMAEYAPKTASVAVRAPSRTLVRIKAGDLVVRPEQPPQEQGGSETTVSLRAVFAGPTVPSDIVNSTRFLSVTPKFLRIVYLFRQPATGPPEGSAEPTPMPLAPTDLAPTPLAPTVP